MKKNRAYFIEFIIVTAGVLMALFLSNLKESNQERKYYKASIETINIEIQENHSNLERSVEQQTNLLDTLLRYGDSSHTILELFQKTKGLQTTSLNSAGLDFYQKNEVYLIDFKIMTKLINMSSSSDIIRKKADMLADCAYENILESSKESKKMVILHLQNLLKTEKHLLKNYKDYIKEHIDC